MTRYAVLSLLVLQGCTCTTRETSITANLSTLCYSVALSVNVKEVCK